jgi:hypothetical protein
MNGVEGLTITPATCSFWQRTVRNYCDGKSEDVREASEILFLSELLSTRPLALHCIDPFFFQRVNGLIQMASVRQLIGRTIFNMKRVASSHRFDNPRFWKRLCDRDSRVRFSIKCDVPPLVALRDFHVNRPYLVHY